MPQRTRSFESLERRRLLASLTAFPLDGAPAIISAAHRTGDSTLIDSAAVASRSDGSGANGANLVDNNAGADSDGAAPIADADGGETTNEYIGSGSARLMAGTPLAGTDGAALAAIDNIYVGSEATGTAPFYSGSSYAPTKTYTTTSTDQPATGPATLASMALPTPPLQGNMRAAEEQPVASPTPAAAGSPSIARSAVGGLEATPDEIMPPSVAAGPLADLEPPGTTAPVAMVPAAANSALQLVVGRGSSAANLDPRASAARDSLDAYFATSPWLTGLVSSAASADLADIEQAIDRLCERMERWGEELLQAAGEWRFSESVVLAVGAAAAFEYVRAQFRDSGKGPFAENTGEPWQPRLRRSAGPPPEEKRRFLRGARNQA